MRKATIALVMTGLLATAAAPAFADGPAGGWEGDLPLYRKLFTSNNCKAWSACSDLDGIAVEYIDVSEEMEAAREKIDEDPNDDFETVWVNAGDLSIGSHADMRVCWYDGAHQLLGCDRGRSTISAPVPYDTDHAKIIILSGINTEWYMEFFVTVDFTKWF